MTEELTGRRARRQALMEQLCEALGPLLSPRILVEALGGRGVAVSCDGARGGIVATRATPWLHGLTVRQDLRKTAHGVAHIVHGAVTEQWPGTTRIGPAAPDVSARGGFVVLRFRGISGEPLPDVAVPLLHDK